MCSPQEYYCWLISFVHVHHYDYPTYAMGKIVRLLS